VSIGGPVRRNASDLSPPSFTPCGCNERASVSGLYCKTMIFCTAPESGSTSTMPPLTSRGEFGNALMAQRVSWTLKQNFDCAVVPRAAFARQHSDSCKTKVRRLSCGPCLPGGFLDSHATGGKLVDLGQIGPELPIALDGVE